MRILLSGSSGLVGTAFKEFAKKKGHEVVSLTRHKQELENDVFYWSPEIGYINASSCEGFDAVVNLAGESIAGGRWTEARKQRILDSRVMSTELLSHTLIQLKKPPKVFISASAVGFYGDCGDTLCTERAVKGKGFLADVCQQWEAATKIVQISGIRTVNLRFGVILSPQGGMLTKVLTPFKLGLGGILGSGNQYMSWVAMEDVVASIFHIIGDASLAGPINIVSPNPVTNKVFTETLGAVLNRPTVIPVPAFVLKILLGSEMAEELILSSVRAVPEELVQSNYQFVYPDLREALVVNS